jgi:hypothetical protein
MFNNDEFDSALKIPSSNNDVLFLDMVYRYKKIKLLMEILSNPSENEVKSGMHAFKKIFKYILFIYRCTCKFVSKHKGDLGSKTDSMCYKVQSLGRNVYKFTNHSPKIIYGDGKVLNIKPGNLIDLQNDSEVPNVFEKITGLPFSKDTMEHILSFSPLPSMSQTSHQVKRDPNTENTQTLSQMLSQQTTPQSMSQQYIQQAMKQQSKTADLSQQYMQRAVKQQSKTNDMSQHSMSNTTRQQATPPALMQQATRYVNQQVKNETKTRQTT